MAGVAPVIVPAVAAHTATLIFLHGLGDSGHGWAGTLAALKGDHVKLVCPTAPVIPVTLNGGMQMTSWFDLRTLDPNLPEDVDGIKRAKTTVQGMIQAEIDNGIPAERIVLGGFSQGGALAIYTGLTGPLKIGGIIALSAWVPLHKQIDLTAINKVPLLQCHGESDILVQYAFGVMSSKLMTGHLPEYQFRSFPGLGHSSCPEEMLEVRNFLRKVIP